jgi:pteridine reductase
MNGNRVALVTGAGRRRIGNVVAHDLAAAGYAVALHYHSSGEAAEATIRELRQRGVEASAHQANVAVEGEVANLVGDVVAKEGCGTQPPTTCKSVLR